VTAVQYTFTHKKHTEYRERKIHNNKKLGTYITIKQLIWEVRAVPRLCELYPGICLTTEEKSLKKHNYGNTTYITGRHSTIHRRKTVTMSSTMSQNTEYTTEKTVHIR
jgi:hypothetical protein